MGKEIIHIEWEGPIAFDEINKFNNGNIDYGVYQIYGPHHGYGLDILLYIGKAQLSTFGKRIKEHKSDFQEMSSDFAKVNIYIGRIAGNATPSDKKWEEQIDLAEKILIFTHKPIYNAREIKWLSDKVDNLLKDIHVLNWGSYKNLLPEVSGARWTNKYAYLENYDVYGKHRRKK